MRKQKKRTALLCTKGILFLNRLRAEPRSVVVHLLLQFAALLGFKRQRGGRTREKARDTDRFTRLSAPAVLSFVDALDGCLNLLQKLALAVAGTKLQSVLLFNRSPVERIGSKLRLAKRPALWRSWASIASRRARKKAS